MKISKLTSGQVEQVWDTDKQQWVSQTFITLDQPEVQYVDTESGYGINQTDFEERVIGKVKDLPFDMVQPIA